MSLKLRLTRAERAARPMTPNRIEREAYGLYLSTLSLEERLDLYTAKMQELENALTPEERAEQEARYEHLRGMPPQELLREFQKLLKRGL